MWLSDSGMSTEFTHTGPAGNTSPSKRVKKAVTKREVSGKQQCMEREW